MDSLLDGFGEESNAPRREVSSWMAMMEWSGTGKGAGCGENRSDVRVFTIKALCLRRERIIMDNGRR